MSYRITADQHALAARRDGLPPQYIVSVYALPTITTARTNPTFGLSRAEYDRIMMDIECEAVSSDIPAMSDTQVLILRQEMFDRDYQDMRQYPA